MEFTQLRDARPATLTTVTAHWKKASRQMQSAESLAGTVSGLIAAGNWQGAAHDAATESVASRRTELMAGQSRADAVAKIISNGQQEAAAAKRKLDEVLAEVAEDEDLSVDESGVVTAHFSQGLLESLLPNIFEDSKKKVEAKAKVLTGRIREAVAEATKADKTAASAVRTAITAGADQFGEVKGAGFVGSIPGPQSSPASVKKWWDGLTALQRGYLLNAQPDLIGRLNGVPAQYRDLANRRVLDGQIDAAQQKIAELEAKPWGKGIGPELIRTKDRLEALQAIGHRLDLSGAQGNKERAYLLLLDGNGDGKGIVSIGNPDTANKVFTLVPGMTNDLNNFPDAIKWADRMVLDANNHGGHNTAGIVYLGYDAPDLFSEASTPNQANQSAQDFARFQEGLRQTHIGPRSLNTVVGHSYGSLLVGTAARDYGLGPSIDQAVFIGSPGVGVDHVEQLGIDGDGDGKPDGKNVYGSIANSDPIPSFYGVQPHDDAGLVQFGGKTFSSLATHVLSGHIGYGDDDQTGPNGARTNIARIVTGNGDEITNKDLPGIRGWSQFTHGEITERSKIAGDYLGGSITTAGNQTGQFLADTGTYLGDQVKSGGNEIAGGIKSVGDDSGDTVKSWGQKLDGSLTSTTNSIGQSIKDVDLPGPLQKLNQELGDDVKDLGKDLGGGVKSTGDQIGNQIKSTGQDLGNQVKSTGDDWGNQVKSTGNQLGSGVKSIGQEAGDKLEQYVKTKGETVEQEMAAKIEKGIETNKPKVAAAEDFASDLYMGYRVGKEQLNHLTEILK